MSEKYDVVIIGAGIGGLVCGCYLAKAGLKVLIVEQQNKPGGYCTSFERQGYRFDVGVHYLGGIKRGVLGKILDDLKLKDKIRFTRSDPTDKIVMPDNITYIRVNPYETIEEFKKTFPKEDERIEKFFKFIMNSDFLSIYRKTKSLNFASLLDEFFDDYKLKSTLGILLNNLGLSPKKASALTSLILFKEFILDPGYYPIGGMGNFSLHLAKQFQKYGGELCLSTKADQIIIKNNKVNGCIINKRELINSNYVVSNADATETFTQLIKENTKERKVIKKLIPSPSLFVLYLGLDKKISNINGCNIWKSNVYEIDNYMLNLTDAFRKKKIPFFMVSFPSEHDYETKMLNKQVMQVYLIAPYYTKNFWEINRESLSEKVIKELEKENLFIKNKIRVKLTAIPPTFKRYTSNKRGAAFGWASTVQQVDSSILPQASSIDGLVLAGHWCMIGNGQGGIPTVAFSGKKASELILKSSKK